MKQVKCLIHALTPKVLTPKVLMKKVFLLLMLILIFFSCSDNKIMDKNEYRKFMKCIFEKDLETAKKMVEAGFDVNNYVSDDGATIIYGMLNSRTGKDYSKKNKRKDICWFLDNFSVNLKIQYYQAYLEGPLGIINRWFVEDTRPPIFLLAFEEYEDNELLKILLDNGADINIQSLIIGKTPLHEAYARDNPEVFKFLLDQGADPCIKTKKGYSVYKIVLNQKEEPYFSYINNKTIECIE